MPGESNRDLESHFRVAADLLQDGAASGDVTNQLVAKGVDVEAAREVVSQVEAARAQSIREDANKNMRHGAIWCMGGIVVSAVSYQAASEGGSYVMAWGAILFGAIQFLRGVSQLSSVPRAESLTRAEVVGAVPSSTPPQVSADPIAEPEADYRWVWWLVGTLFSIFFIYVLVQITAGKLAW